MPSMAGQSVQLGSPFWLSPHKTPGSVSQPGCGLLGRVGVRSHIQNQNHFANVLMQYRVAGHLFWSWARQMSVCLSVLFRQERVLLGYEALVVGQGFPAEFIPEKASDPQLKDLAGNAFSSTVIGALHMALMATFGAVGP